MGTLARLFVWMRVAPGGRRGGGGGGVVGGAAHVDSEFGVLSSRGVLPYVMLAALQVADIVTTAVALTHRGVSEGNAWASSVMATYGQLSAYAIKVVGMGLVIGVLYCYRRHRWAAAIAWSAIAVSCYAVINNSVYLVVTR